VLGAVVQVAFDAAARLVGRRDDAGAGGAQGVGGVFALMRRVQQDLQGGQDAVVQPPVRRLSEDEPSERGLAGGQLDRAGRQREGLFQAPRGRGQRGPQVGAAQQQPRDVGGQVRVLTRRRGRSPGRSGRRPWPGAATRRAG
jgi:hypothetical protein